MRVRAKYLGFFDTVGDGKAREFRAGQEFDIPDGSKLGRWMERVEPHPAHPSHPSDLKPAVKPPAPSGKSVI